MIEERTMKVVECDACGGLIRDETGVAVWGNIHRVGNSCDSDAKLGGGLIGDNFNTQFFDEAQPKKNGVRINHYHTGCIIKILRRY